MIASATRIVAVDDQEPDLDAIVKGLSQLGLACLSVCHPSPKRLPKLPNIRIIFMDLHLSDIGPVPDPRRHFQVIETLVDEMQPEGPYIIVLWTLHPEESEKARAFFLSGTNIPTPAAILCLDKTEHLLNGQLKDPEKLKEKITALWQEVPQISALLDWEASVLGAAGKTVKVILGAIEQRPLENPGTASAKLDVLLSALAIEAVGAPNVALDHYSAIRDALSPLLYDQLAHAGTDPSRREMWKAAITQIGGGSNLSTLVKAHLNRMLHIAAPEEAKAASRGSVIYLSREEMDDGAFQKMWGIDWATFVKEEMKLDPSDQTIRPLVMQVQASCDHAQQNRALPQFVLGLERRFDVRPSKTLKDAVWVSPPLFFGQEVSGRASEACSDEIKVWAFHFRFVAGLTAERVKGWVVEHRMRNQMLDEVVTRLHTQAARLGMMSFRGDPEKGRKQPQVARAPSGFAPAAQARPVPAGAGVATQSTAVPSGPPPAAQAAPVLAGTNAATQSTPMPSEANAATQSTPMPSEASAATQAMPTPSEASLQAQESQKSNSDTSTSDSGKP